MVHRKLGDFWSLLKASGQSLGGAMGKLRKFREGLMGIAGGSVDLSGMGFG